MPVSEQRRFRRWKAFMTPQESDLITILLDRLNKTEGQLRDPEAETLIRETTAARTDASYSLVQTVLIQDLSLHNAQSRITDLETQLTETKRASSAPPSFLGDLSFLGAVFGQGQPLGVRTSSVPTGGPGTDPPAFAGTPQPGYAPEQRSAAHSAPGAGLGGGSFLRSAAMTATGIAGGALLFEGIQSMFGPHVTAGITGNQAAMPGLGETVFNNHYGAAAGASGGESIDEHAGAGYYADLSGADLSADSGPDFSGNNAA
jgi:uncharacterized protein